MHTNTLIHGDCLHVLPTIPSESVDFILTDPPYLVSYKPRDGRTVPRDGNAAWLKPAFRQMHRVLKADGFCFTFYGWPHADRFMVAFRAAGFRPVGHFSFPKSYTSSVGHVRCQHECGYLASEGSSGPSRSNRSAMSSAGPITPAISFTPRKSRSPSSCHLLKPTRPHPAPC